EKYPYQFRVVNDTEINAFALPGGFVYVNRGIFESADNEAQLAGVMGHEISHVALRHGTTQMTKSSGAAAIIAIMPKGKSAASTIFQAGATLGLNVGMMRFSRDAESQADLMGTQILYDSGYDPIAMPQFFQKLDDGSSRSSQFFSDHPNPGNRITAVKGEIAKLGTVRATRQDSAEFQAAKQRIHAMPQPKPKPTQPAP
ncbi:MAG TPA: M48 family metalloprotease, partial [Terriglobia bacterium]|nr:M48 family metalloprotease [Terriglobia bacterium]